MTVVDKIDNILSTNPSAAEFDHWLVDNATALIEMIYDVTGVELNDMRFDDYFYKEIAASPLYKDFQRTGLATDPFLLFVSLLAVAAQKLATLKLTGLADTLNTDLPDSPAKFRLQALLEFSAVDDVREDYLKKFPVVLELLHRSISTSEDNNMRLLMDILIHYFHESHDALTTRGLKAIHQKIKLKFSDPVLIAQYPFLDHTVLSALLSGHDPFNLLKQSVKRVRLTPSGLMEDLFRRISREYFGHEEIDHEGGSIFGYSKQAILDDVIVRGRADFRVGYKHISDDEKVLLYCFFNMKKHFFTSYAVLQIVVNSLKAVFNQKDYTPIFIDLGCGPMTSGLALGDIIYEQTGVPLKFTYVGIDIADAMLRRAKTFESEPFFSRESSFLYLNNWNELSAVKLTQVASRHSPILFNASYLFASTSLDPIDLAQFVLRIRKKCDTVYFIFQNPKSEARNVKYEEFKNQLTYDRTVEGNELIQYRPSARNNAEEYVYYEILKIN